MNPNDPEPPPPSDPSAIEIVVRVPSGRGPSDRRESGANEPKGLGWVPVAALAVGLGLSLLFTQHGFFLFFLPIILPFGLGGGALLRRWGKRGRRG